MPVALPSLVMDTESGMKAAALDKSRILVVDDEPQLLGALRSLLSIEGYHVLTADEGGRALVRVRECRPALIITDLSMAPMGGIELCRRVRETSNVPIIVLSGESADRKVDAFDAGADDYIMKPFELDELLARIRTLLRRAAGNVDTAIMEPWVGDELDPLPERSADLPERSGGSVGPQLLADVG
jgi:DNA-binding response OmpR family regulator